VVISSRSSNSSNSDIGPESFKLIPLVAPRLSFLITWMDIVSFDLVQHIPQRSENKNKTVQNIFFISKRVFVCMLILFIVLFFCYFSFTTYNCF